MVGCRWLRLALSQSLPLQGFCRPCEDRSPLGWSSNYMGPEILPVDPSFAYCPWMNIQSQTISRTHCNAAKEVGSGVWGGARDLLPHNASHLTRSAMVGCEGRNNNSGFVFLVNCHCRLKTGMMGRRTHCTHKLIFCQLFSEGTQFESCIRIWSGLAHLRLATRRKPRIRPSHLSKFPMPLVTTGQ
jgi:hypothetical protein